MPRSLLAVALTTSLFAQGGPIYIVDAASGPGTNFTDIQTAVLAVPDGSTLLVRPGTYPPVVIDGKGIAVLADPSFAIGGATVAGPLLDIRNTLAHQAVLARGLVSSGWITGVLVRVANAAGPVTLEGAGQVLSVNAGSPALAIADSPQVDVRDWTIQGHEGAPAITVTNSGVVFELCSVAGSHGWIGLSSPHLAQSGLAATNSQVQLVHSSVSGGAGAFGMPVFLPGAPAIGMNGGSLRAMGLPSHAISGGASPFTGAVPAITGSGVVRIDPLIPLNAAPTGVTLTQLTMPGLLADCAPPGGVVTADRHGAPGVLCALALSLRAPSFTVPWLPDPVWLDPQGLIVAAVGITPPSGPFTATTGVPNVATLRGFQFVWQAADLDATGIVAVSNPSPSFVR